MPQVVDEHIVVTRRFHPEQTMNFHDAISARFYRLRYSMIHDSRVNGIICTLILHSDLRAP